MGHSEPAPLSGAVRVACFPDEGPPPRGGDQVRSGLRSVVLAVAAEFVLPTRADRHLLRGGGSAQGPRRWPRSCCCLRPARLRCRSGRCSCLAGGDQARTVLLVLMPSPWWPCSQRYAC